MGLRDFLTAMIDLQVAGLLACPAFRTLETGRAAREAYDGFLANVVRTHLTATERAAFLYAVAPPASAAGRLQVLLDRLHHPVLLRQLASGAGLGSRLGAIEALAAADVRRAVVEPSPYRTLGEAGFAALLEVVAFDCLLARVAGPVVGVLGRHRGLGSTALRWWTERAEADGRRAAAGLDDLVHFVDYYALDATTARAIAGETFRENLFVRRYFREPPAGGGLTPGG